MTSRQTAAICATILLAAAANLAGGFAIQFYFEHHRPRRHADTGRFPSSDPSTSPAPGGLTDEKVLRRLVETELPEATSTEQEVWAEESKGLRPDEIRDLLEMRRRFGSDVSLLDRPLLDEPLVLPDVPPSIDVRPLPETDDSASSWPDAVPAPVPATSDGDAHADPLTND